MKREVAPAEWDEREVQVKCLESGPEACLMERELRSLDEIAYLTIALPENSQHLPCFRSEEVRRSDGRIAGARLNTMAHITVHLAASPPELLHLHSHYLQRRCLAMSEMVQQHTGAHVRFT